MVSSPKFGDKAAWEQRLATAGSLEKLVHSAMKGKNAMPKKGRCINCGPEEIKGAIEYMMNGGY